MSLLSGLDTRYCTVVQSARVEAQIVVSFGKDYCPNLDYVDARYCFVACLLECPDDYDIEIFCAVNKSAISFSILFLVILQVSTLIYYYKTSKTHKDIINQKSYNHDKKEVFLS